MKKKVYNAPVMEAIEFMGPLCQEPVSGNDGEDAAANKRGTVTSSGSSIWGDNDKKESLW